MVYAKFPFSHLPRHRAERLAERRGFDSPCGYASGALNPSSQAERRGFESRSGFASGALNPSSQAERRGFEPRNRFRRLHAFQACLFSHSSIFPLCVATAKLIFIGQNTEYFSQFLQKQGHFFDTANIICIIK